MGLFDRFKKQQDESKAELSITGTALSQQEENTIVAMSNAILMETHAGIMEHNFISVPIVELASLGGAVSSLIPTLRTVTQNATIGTSGLYQLVNVAVGDTLKVVKNGNFWGAFKTAEGTSKFAQLVDAAPLAATSKTVMPINPATMMMAVALFSIEQQKRI